MGRKKMSDAARIRAYYAKNPDAKPGDVAVTLKVKPSSVYLVRSKMRNGPAYKTAVTRLLEKGIVTAPGPIVYEPPVAPQPEPDSVNHPPHYKTGGIETIDFIEAKGLNYRLGNVVKYVTRAEHKGNRKEDLRKAMWYLQREIEQA